MERVVMNISVCLCISRLGPSLCCLRDKRGINIPLAVSSKSTL